MLGHGAPLVTDRSVLNRKASPPGASRATNPLGKPVVISDAPLTQTLPSVPTATPDATSSPVPPNNDANTMTLPSGASFSIIASSLVC
jgi:hypothetical protein